MLSTPLATIDEDQPPSSSAVVSGLLHARDRLEAQLCEALVEFVGRGQHQVEGWGSPVGWLKAQGLTDREAKRLAVRVSRLGAWPTLASEWFDAVLTSAQVELVVGLVPAHLVDLYADHDAEVSAHLGGLSLRDTRIALREWVTRAEAVLAGPDPGEHDESGDTNLWLSHTLDGKAVLDATLDSETAALTDAALRIAERPDEPGEFRTAAQRRVDALGRIVRFFCDNFAALGDRPGRQHPHLAVGIELPDLLAGALRGLGIRTAHDLEQLLLVRPVGIFEEGVLRDALAHASGTPRTHDGHPLDPASLARLFTTGTLIHRLLSTDGIVLDRGRSIRLATPNLREAILVRDQGCRFPQCDAPASWLHAHHLRHWENGGPTDVANLFALCATHHGVVHRRGWALAARPDGTLTFTRPDGRTLTSPPPRRHRPPPLVLHHPALAGLLGIRGPDPAPPERDDQQRRTRELGPRTPSDDARPHDPTGCTRAREPGDEADPSDRHTRRLVRARVVDLVRLHRASPPARADDPPSTGASPTATGVALTWPAAV